MDDGNAFTVIEYGEGCGCECDTELCDLTTSDRFGGRARDVIDGIHHELVEDLVEPGIEVNGSPDHLMGGDVIDPAALFVRVTGTDVGVGELENVLPLSQLLVGLGFGFFGFFGFF